MEKLPPKYKAKCKQCGRKNEPRYPDKSKGGKWVYICKDCCGFKYTKGDKRTIKEKYNPKVLSFIRKQFNKIPMSFPYNPKIINRRKYAEEIENITGKNKIKQLNKILNRKVNQNVRSYSFRAIHDIVQKHFDKIYKKEKDEHPNKNIEMLKIPSVYAIGDYFKRLHGKRLRMYPNSFKKNPYEERDTFT